MDRRQFMLAMGLGLAGLCGLLAGCGTSELRRGEELAGRLKRLEAEFAAIEAKSGGRLGVAVLDTQTGERVGYRADERFAMCSTFKLLAVAATLSRVDGGKDSLARRVQIVQADLATYSPATKGRVGGRGMSVEELCEAAMTVSDNTAASLLLRGLGGPAGLTAYARFLGDTQTRLDRTEPDLNEAAPGDSRDTTTPAAMLADLQSLTLKDALSPASRELLICWMVKNKTGDARLRAGLPGNWRVGDKTGSGLHGTTNDVGVLWPAGRRPLLVCVYLTNSAKTDDQRDAVIASVARAIAAAVR